MRWGNLPLRAAAGRLRQSGGCVGRCTWVVGGVAIGLAVFLMTITDTEHLPAAATALGIAIYGWSGATVAFVLAFAICLAMARRVLGRRLVDLY